MKKVITMEMPEYPELLKKIKAPPEKLFCSGDISLLNSRCAAVVGSRKTTQYGRNTAVEISSRIASHGITVVSGMAMWDRYMRPYRCAEGRRRHRSGAGMRDGHMLSAGKCETEGTKSKTMD